QSFIRESERLLAQAYGSKQAFFLVNGSTTGNLAMLLSTLREGDGIILPRSIHRSIIHALSLVHATPIWVANDMHPDYQIPLPLTPAQVADAVRQHPHARAVFINSPTYHGLCAEIGAITEIVHRAHMLLLADEAWGAHLAFHPAYPASAADKADLCVQSMHKTLPVTNQGAVLHCNTTRIQHEYVANILSMFQTTSPSYVLLSTMDVARRQMVLQGFDILEEILAIADYARRRINAIEGLQCLSASELPADIRLDPVKLTIRLDPQRFSMTGYALEQCLCERFGVQVEMADAQTILLMIKPGITRDDINYLALVLQQIQHEASKKAPLSLAAILPRQCHWKTILYPFQAFRSPYRLHPLAGSAGEICWESIYAYPPGTPVVMPGECLTQEIVDYLQEIIRLGAVVKGVTERGEVLVCESPLILVQPHRHKFRRQRRTIRC
ncbi:MAG TPA: aminotransferase class I/II-fold pyridoxal phosphate-dependent enzyme, partial [Armatimonadota bacterium]